MDPPSLSINHFLTVSFIKQVWRYRPSASWRSRLSKTFYDPYCLYLSTGSVRRMKGHFASLTEFGKDLTAVIAVARTGKASFVDSYVQTRVMGQYNGK